MEFSLNSLLLIHFTTMAMCLLSHGPHVTLVIWHSVTVTCNMTICDHPSHHCDIVTKSHDTSHAPSCSCKSNKKRKEKKRNINNDLANLPSHNTSPSTLHTSWWLSRWDFPPIYLIFNELLSTLVAYWSYLHHITNRLYSSSVCSSSWRC